jgi:hypothetical protein
LSQRNERNLDLLILRKNNPASSPPRNSRLKKGGDPAGRNPYKQGFSTEFSFVGIHQPTEFRFRGQRRTLCNSFESVPSRDYKSGIRRPIGTFLRLARKRKPSINSRPVHAPAINVHYFSRT